VNESTATSPPAMPARTKRRRIRWIFCGFFGAWFVSGFYNCVKPLPAGVNVAAPTQRLLSSDIELLFDLTKNNPDGTYEKRQVIFDRMLEAIDHAERTIALDIFLFNSYVGIGDRAGEQRPLAATLTAHLLARKKARPRLAILLVTDPINDVYGGARSAYLTALEGAGIVVVRTDLGRLRDSNPIYSGLWRLAFGWWADRVGSQSWLPNPLDHGPSRVGLGSWLRLLNFKANHRKLMVADDGAGGWISIVTSANPHDASSLHSNVALLVHGAMAREILASERSIAAWSSDEDRIPPLPAIPASRVGAVDARFVSEGAIKSAMLAAFGAATAHDEIGVAVFYLSERSVIAALTAAAARGVIVRVVLDPNRDAFGYKKNGIPNRPVAAELEAHGVAVRWYRTHGEQFHSKLAYLRHGRDFWMTLGSANYTRRNLGDFNLEANIELKMPASDATARAVFDYFSLLWGHEGDTENAYTAPYSAWTDESILSYWRYRLMEASGCSTF
jgi:phosphatidylserine/phosphatidylglycerophosphate/cardiolipin synthase-like enzyme